MNSQKASPLDGAERYFVKKVPRLPYGDFYGICTVGPAAGWKSLDG
jgi:hypothetical protein